VRSASECVRRSHSDADQTLKAPVWRSGRLNSHHHTRHYKTVLSVLCLTWRCELDNCYQRVQTSYFPSATVLSCRESNSHHRSGQYTTPTRQLCRVWRGGVNGPGSQSWRGRVPQAPQCGCAYDLGWGGGRCNYPFDSTLRTDSTRCPISSSQTDQLQFYATERKSLQRPSDAVATAPRPTDHCTGQLPVVANLFLPTSHITGPNV